MKTFLSYLFLLFLTTTLFAQDTTYNLDFEILENEKSKGWSDFKTPGYKTSFDKDIVNSGNVSGAIESVTEDAEYMALSYSIPADFGGKKIKLTGYLKTENVQDGYAGLWMRIDPQIAFDNMASREINGTTEWTKYEIELDYKSAAKTIVVGGLLVGKGKIWIDDLVVTIDGKPLDQAPEKELTKAQKDQEFDQGSNITLDALSDKQINNLVFLGRVWGFLKYYHPKVGTGDINWDYELFRVLPNYINAKTIAKRDAVLMAWIDKLGPIKPCDNCKDISEDAFLKPNHDWMTTNVSEALTNKLQYILENRHQGEHYYIGMMPGVGNPEFKNENSYADMTYPDDGFRLLSVYRYWNMINYYFPYKHLMDKKWNSCLPEYIEKFIKAKNELEYEKAAIQMIGDIKDTHANLWGGNDKIQEERGEFVAPVHVKFVENKLVVDDLFEDEKSTSSGFKLGDVITHIDGTSVDQIVKDKHDFYPASNQPTRLRDIGFDILRSTKNTMSLTIIRDGKTYDKTIDLYNRKEITGYYRWYAQEEDKPSFKMLDNNIGYVTLKNIKQEDVALIREQFKDTKGIIIDIRNYPSAFMPFTLGTFFTSETSDFVKFTSGNINYPGEFTFGSELSIPSKGDTYQGKVVVLINEISQSQAEYTTMAFRAGDNVTVIGSTTAGADGNVSRIPLPGGMRTMISGIGVYYPDGTETQRIGIVPDVEVKPTIEGIKNGRDELLEKAQDIISKNITKDKRIKD